MLSDLSLFNIMTKTIINRRSNTIWLVVFIMSLNMVKGQDKKLGYIEPGHKTKTDGIIEVTKPGNYGEPGATYMLTRDISSAKSAVFLGKDVTLDLNGYTISYADDNYDQIPNSGFEEGTKGWDISKAPGAKVVNTEEVHTFIGKKLMSLQKGDELISPYIHLPVANRSYFAMLGITGRYFTETRGDPSKNMQVSIYVEDEHGNNVEVVTKYADTTMVSSPAEHKSPRPSGGGGFIFAHLNGLPEGKYRMRIKAETDCLIDEIDIRPAMDVGIGIVDKTHPMGHYDHMIPYKHSAFFDYTEDVSSGTPLPGIPTVEGEGTVTIKNGVIKSGAVGVLSWGVQSTADNVKIILDNVKIESSGINAIAVDVPFATITNSTFKIDNPFIIYRGGSSFYAVDLRGKRPSEVSFSEFYGGQGNLVFKGNHSSVHNNYFVNKQTVTNHYSVMAMGDSSRIFENRFEPEIGSGVEIYRHNGIEIFNNVFHIEAAPPSTEYHLHYSTNAIRIADYGAERGSPTGAFNNKVYNNRFIIKGKDYPQYPDYIPLASAFFYSASAGGNSVFGNEIFIDQQDPGTKAQAWAFYIGNADGGEFYNNNITTNVPPIWVANSYQSASNIDLYNNKVKKSPETIRDFKPVKIGHLPNGYPAENINFRSNEYENLDFAVDVYDQDLHSYTVSWTLNLHLVDNKKKTIKNEEVRIMDKNNEEIFKGKTNKEGILIIELPEYSVHGTEKLFSSPYTIEVRNKKEKVELNKNKKLVFVVKETR